MLRFNVETRKIPVDIGLRCAHTSGMVRSHGGTVTVCYWLAQRGLGVTKPRHGDKREDR